MDSSKLCFYHRLCFFDYYVHLLLGGTPRMMPTTRITALSARGWPEYDTSLFITCLCMGPCKLSKYRNLACKLYLIHCVYLILKLCWILTYSERESLDLQAGEDYSRLQDFNPFQCEEERETFGVFQESVQVCLANIENDAKRN